VIGSTLLLMIGLMDLVEGGRPGYSILGQLLVLVGIPVLVVLGLGLHPLTTGMCVALALGWMWATASSKLQGQSAADPGSAAPRLWPVILLFLLVFGVTAYDRTADSARGFLVDAYSFAALKSASSISLETVMAAAAIVIFLIKSANKVTLAALGRAHEEDTRQEAGGKDEAAPTSVEPRNKWEVFIWGKKAASVRTGKKPEPGPALKGGRIIGPIERLLIVVLAFAGAPQIIAALAAAKGVVRFPEIAEDRGSGSKAEEFLVGSLASWTLSAIAVLYISLVHNG
jgi:hypothetical protein